MRFSSFLRTYFHQWLNMETFFFLVSYKYQCSFFNSTNSKQKSWYKHFFFLPRLDHFFFRIHIMLQRHTNQTATYPSHKKAHSLRSKEQERWIKKYQLFPHMRGNGATTISPYKICVAVRFTCMNIFQCAK